VAQLGDSTFRARFVATAQQHAVLGLALAQLDSGLLQGAVSRQIAAELSGLLGRLRRRAALWVIERDRVLAVLRRIGVDAVMLKGGALCTTLYAEPVQREFGDLDLLVTRAEVGPVVDALLRCGYINPWNEAQLRGYYQHHFHIRLEHPNGFVVEVHFGLTAPGAPFGLDPGAFMSASQVRQDHGSRIRLPRPEHVLLHVVSQNTQDGFNRLVRFVDIDRIVRSAPDLDWTLMENVARRGGLETVLAVSLRLTRRLFGTDIPRAVQERLRPGSLARYHVGLLEPLSSVLTQHFRERPAADGLLRLWLLPDTAARARYLGRLLTGRDEPLRWIWRGGTSPDDPRGATDSPWLVPLKLATYQIGLYLSQATPSRRHGVLGARFWSG
jgi:hypothetical protein